MIGHDAASENAAATLPQAEAPCNPASPVEIAEHLLRILRDGDPAVGHESARVMIGAALTYLAEHFGTQHAVATTNGLLSHLAPPPVLPAAELAPAILDHLRAMPRDEAHERARAVVAGSGAFLHEAYGEGYAAAVLGGALQAAAEHGDAMRGGRASTEALH